MEHNGRHQQSAGEPATTELESKAIEHLRERLHDNFPEVDEEKIDETVAAHYHQLDDSPIREFVPVLVEHAATSDLISERDQSSS
jgi:hypothetical protein